MLIDSQPVILLISVVQPTKFLRGLLLLINNDMKEKSYIHTRTKPSDIPSLCPSVDYARIAPTGALCSTDTIALRLEVIPVTTTKERKRCHLSFNAVLILRLRGTKFLRQ